MGSVFSYESVETQEEVEYDSSITENSESVQEEPFDFAKLPSNLQFNVLEKFEYDQFSCFDQTSLLAHNVCSSNSFSVPFEMYSVSVYKKKISCSNLHHFNQQSSVPRIPWAVASRPPVQIQAFYLAIMSQLTNGRIQAVTRSLQKNRTTVKYLFFETSFTWPVEDLEIFIKVCSPSCVTFNEFLPRQYFNCTSLQKVDAVYCENSGCTDEELVKLNSSVVQLMTDFVTSKGLNTILRQWTRREREIKNIKITFGSTPRPKRVEDILRGIETNLVWSRDSDQDSLLNDNPLDELPGEYTYCMWRPDEPENTVFLHIGNSSFEAWAEEGEKEQ